MKRTRRDDESVGRTALGILEARVRRRWTTLGDAERQGLGGDPLTAVKLIEQLAAWVGKRSEILEAFTVARRRERLNDHPIVANGFGAAEGQVRSLPHLGADGSAEEREGERLAHARARRREIHWNSLDDRIVALGGFEIRDLDRMRRRCRRLGKDLRALFATPLARRRLGLGPATTMALRTPALLDVLDRVVIPELIQRAKEVSARRLGDTRERVRRLLDLIHRATGQYCWELASDVLNWKAPRDGDGQWWTPRLLKDWISTATRANVRSRKGRRSEAAGRARESDTSAR